jgi:hypothetical protein
MAKKRVKNIETTAKQRVKNIETTRKAFTTTLTEMVNDLAKQTDDPEMLEGLAHTIFSAVRAYCETTLLGMRIFSEALTKKAQERRH